MSKINWYCLQICQDSVVVFTNTSDELDQLLENDELHIYVYIVDDTITLINNNPRSYVTNWIQCTITDEVKLSLQLHCNEKELLANISYILNYVF